MPTQHHPPLWWGGQKNPHEEGKTITHPPSALHQPQPARVHVGNHQEWHQCIGHIVVYVIIHEEVFILFSIQVLAHLPIPPSVIDLNHPLIRYTRQHFHPYQQYAPPSIAIHLCEGDRRTVETVSRGDRFNQQQFSMDSSKIRHSLLVGEGSACGEWGDRDNDSDGENEAQLWFIWVGVMHPLCRWGSGL